MKNKIIGIVITLIIMIGIMASQVMAASINVSNTEVNKGDQLTVTVNLENATQAIDIVLTYDASKFEYVKGSANSTLGDMAVNDTNEGEIIISAASLSNTTKAVNYTFVAKENTDAAVFTASGLVTESGEGFTNDTVSVSVVEPAEEPTNPEDPTQPENPTDEPTTPENPTDDTQNGSETNADTPLVDEDGNVITELPQTGVSVYQVVAVVAVLAVVVALVVRKIRK